MDKVAASMAANNAKNIIGCKRRGPKVNPFRTHSIAIEIAPEARKDTKIQKKHIPTSSQTL
ncbi:MAG: hypothetical protein ACE5IC_09570, partial [Candidatus Brocadiales bacterium]